MVTNTQKAQDLDQFFTKKSLAEYFFTILEDYLVKEEIEAQWWLEPSAGSGAFYHLMPENLRTGVDISPQIEGIVHADFLEYPLPDKKYITLGNPPFGKNSSLAIKFFNKCALLSEVIAFIVPKTFKKTSVINKLHPEFHLEYSEDLPDHSFELEGVPYNVPCVFQIWKKKTDVRSPIKMATTHTDFEFCQPLDANFAIQRVGVNAGAVKKEVLTVSPQSHYFIKSVEGEEVINTFGRIDWSSVKYNTAGNPSISKGELVGLYETEKCNTLNNI